MTIVRATVELTFPGGDRAGTNTWHIQTANPSPDQGDIGPAMLALEDYYQAIAANVWADNYSARWNGESLTVQAQPQAVPTGDNWTVEGAGSGQASAAGVGLVVGWRTALASRRGRGRTFHTPIVTAAFDTDGTLTPAARSFVQAAASELVNASQVGNNWEFAVYSPTNNSARAFTQARVADKVAFLSSRRD